MKPEKYAARCRSTADERLSSPRASSPPAGNTGWRQFTFDYGRADGFLRIKRGKAARQIFQFADIARPTMALEPLLPGRIDLFGRQAFALRLREEMTDQIRNIFRALAQRRQTQWHDIEPEEQILAEQALLNLQPQILVGRSDDTYIALDRRTAADGRVFALLEHAQQARLRFHRHVADFVEE